MDCEPIIDSIAKQYKVSSDNVRKFITAAIQNGMRDPDEREFWLGLAQDGKAPTVEDVIKYMTAEN